MAAFSTIIAGAGLALSAVGFFQSQQQASANQDIVNQNNAERLRQAGEEREANKKINAYNDQIAASQNRAAESAQAIEGLRLRQTALESVRAKRQVVREALAARGLAVNSAATQGALGGSAIRGGANEIISQGARNIRAVEQNFGIGEDIFGENKKITAEQKLINTAQGNASNVRSTITPANIQGIIPGDTGAGLSNFGGTLINNAGTINRIGTSLFGSGN